MNAARRFPLRWMAAWLLMFGAFVSLAQDQKRYDPSALPDNAALWNLPDGARLRLGKGTAGVLEYSPDGKTLAVGGGAGVWLYDAETGAETGFLQGRKGSVISIDYAPDSKTILIVSTDKTARIWDAETGELLQTLKDNFIYGSYLAAFAPDGKTAAVGADGGIYIWDIETGDCIHRFEGGMGSRRAVKINAFTYSPDGKLIANENDREIHIWDAQTGDPLRILEKYVHESVVVFSPDGKSLATGFSRGYKDWPLNVYNSETGELIRSIKAHTYMITAVMYSPDGSLLVSGAKDKTIKIWDAETGALRTMIGGGENVVTQTAYSPDGKTLVQIVKAADTLRQKHQTRIRIWDAETGALLHAFDGPDTFTASLTFSPNGDSFAFAVPRAHAIWVCGALDGKLLHTIRDPKFGVSMVKYSPDGKILASGNTAGALQLWNPDNGVHIRTFRGHADPIRFIAFSRDGRIIATGGERDGAVHLWNINAGEKLHTLQGHAANAVPAGFSMDGKRLVTFSEDNVLRVWSVDSGAQSHSFGEGEAPVWAYDYSPERKEIALAYKGSGGVSLWSVEKGAVVQTLEGHTEQIESLTYSPDGRWLVSAGGDNAARIWDLDAGRALHTLIGQDHWAQDISFFPNNDTIATRGADSLVSLWSVKTGEFLRAVPENAGRIYAMAMAPDGETFASLSYPDYYASKLFGGNIDIWNARSGARLRTIRGHTSSRLSVDFSPDGKAVASAGMGGVLRIQDANTGETIHEIDGRGNRWRASSARYSPDGKTLLSFGGAGIQIWDAQTGRLIETLEELRPSSFSAFSADGSMLAEMGSEIRIWDLKTRKLRNSFGKELEEILCFSFSPYGVNLAAGSRDGKMRVWNVETGALIQAHKEHPYDVSAIAYSPDGQHIATGCADSVRIWMSGRGSFLVSEQTLDREVESVAYSPDGKFLASGSVDGEVNLWDGGTGEQIKTLKGHTDRVSALSFSPRRQEARQRQLGRDGSALGSVNAALLRLFPLTPRPLSVIFRALSPSFPSPLPVICMMTLPLEYAHT